MTVTQSNTFQRIIVWVGIGLLAARPASPTAEGTWATRADMPTARWGLSTSVVGGKIYAIGGDGPARRALSVVEAYDPATDTWTAKSEMPTARWVHSASVVDGRIYVIGGSPSYPFSGILALEVYEPATDTWTRKADLPRAKYTGATSVVGGKIYTFGGYASRQQVDEYDPVTDTWTRKAGMPTLFRVCPSSSVVDGRIYVSGGHPGSSPYPGINTVEVYDPATDTWTGASDMPTGRYGPHASVVDGMIYVIGGNDGWPAPPLGTVEEYDPGRTLEANPDTAWVGQPVPLEVTVVLGRSLEEAGRWRQMVLDLSPLGIDDAPLEHTDGGRYTLNEVVVPQRSGHHDLPILLETIDGQRRALLTFPLTVWPTADLSIFDDGLACGGELSSRNVERLESDHTAVVYAGSVACAVEGEEGFSGWTVGFPFPPTGALGYRPLRFAIHPGSTTLADGDWFSVMVGPGRGVSLLADGRVDMTRKEWQVVEIPLGLFETDGPYNQVRFSGNFGGLFYLDAVELVLWPEDAEDLVILGDALTRGWEAVERGVESLAPAQTDVVYTGSAACAVQGKESFAGWSVALQPADPVYHFDYELLHFALHPGDLALSGSERFTVGMVPGSAVGLLDRVDVEKKEWQLVEIPLSDFGLDGPVESVKFAGDFAGTFYLDDLVLIPVQSPAPAATAVLEEHLDVVPRGFALHQNYPNRFNSETVIRFALPTAGQVELILYNLIGQRVAMLAQGWRPAGIHAARWDGRDDDGREQASGLYLARLATSSAMKSRKLLLLR